MDLVDLLTELPSSLQEKLKRIRELEGESGELQAQITQRTERLMRMAKGGQTENQKEGISSVRELYEQMLKKSDEKEGVLDELEKGITKAMEDMDAYYKEYSSQIVRRIYANRESLNACEYRTEEENEDSLNTSRPLNDTHPSLDEKAYKQRIEASRVEPMSEGEVAASAHLCRSVVKEPVYCLCQKESYGKMVMCDNSDCPYEWFHFPCIGMVEEPPTDKEWYCAECTKDMKKSQNKKKRAAKRERDKEKRAC
ncbi:hypothetical protein QR680_004462 [Steinernema hermaphroditum]|uniref:Inhibitor of growth protein n=1 Tax=Steinernema hermaphroditum TaxID=289476 RepID=A0AA39HR27_9BILA|nr:hypothetical protein QR680_004462 [Steinernema hermaphroditum]